MYTTGEQLKKEGQDAVWAKASEEWRDRALTALSTLVALKHFFTSDDFRAYATEQEVGQPHKPNAWGALYSTAARFGWMRPTGRFVKSEHKNSHAHKYTIWESLVFEGKDGAEKAPEKPKIIVEWLLKTDGKTSVGFASKEKAVVKIDVYAESRKCARSAVRLYRAECTEVQI